MYISPRFAQVRNLAVAIVNGTITLVILLIAPLGLAAVIINTALVTLSSYITAITADRVVLFLQSDRTPQAHLINHQRHRSTKDQLPPSAEDDIER